MLVWCFVWFSSDRAKFLLPGVDGGVRDVEVSRGLNHGTVLGKLEDILNETVAVLPDERSVSVGRCRHRHTPQTPHTAQRVLRLDGHAATRAEVVAGRLLHHVGGLS